MGVGSSDNRFCIASAYYSGGKGVNLNNIFNWSYCYTAAAAAAQNGDSERQPELGLGAG